MDARELEAKYFLGKIHCLTSEGDEALVPDCAILGDKLWLGVNHLFVVTDAEGGDSVILIGDAISMGIETNV